MDDLELEALRFTRAENVRRKAAGLPPERYVFIGDVYDALVSLETSRRTKAPVSKVKADRGFYG